MPLAITKGMIRNIAQMVWFKQWVGRLVLLAFLMPSAMMVLPQSANAESSFWYYKIEDPRLKKLVHGLIQVSEKLWQLFWTFGWLKQPRIFYHDLKSLFIIWYQLLTHLVGVLTGYVHDLEHEIRGSQCADESCSHLKGH